MGSNPIVLIAPAMAIGAAYYRPLIEAFAAIGWDARAMGRRGFEPDHDQAGWLHDWSYADEIQDIEDAVTSVRIEHPSARLILLGHSLGGQLSVGHQSSNDEVDGMILVGSSLPYFRHFAAGGIHVALMAGLVVPVLTRIFGHLPRPVFGGPGARTLMQEWSRMALTGRPPFATDTLVETPSLLISLEHDTLAPARAVDDLSRRFFAPHARTRWHYCDRDLPAGADNTHVGWVRTPERVVTQVEQWWTRNAAPRITN